MRRVRCEKTKPHYYRAHEHSWLCRGLTAGRYADRCRVATAFLIIIFASSSWVVPRLRRRRLANGRHLVGVNRTKRSSSGRPHTHGVMRLVLYVLNTTITEYYCPLAPSCISSDISLTIFYSRRRCTGTVVTGLFVLGNEKSRVGLLFVP